MGVEHDEVTVLYAGELEVRLSDGLVLAAGRALTLSVREFELLVAMVRQTGTILTRGELYEAVWGGELRPGDRSVDAYVSELRGNLEAAMPDRRFIHPPRVRLPLPVPAGDAAESGDAGRDPAGRAFTRFSQRPSRRLNRLPPVALT